MGAAGIAAVEWELWSTRARLVVTDPAALRDARALVDRHLAEVDDAANRFRDDSEISRFAGPTGFATDKADPDDRAAGARTRRVALSPVLTDLLRAALDAAALTDGDVDPTVGGAVRRLGYDRDLSLVRAHDDGPLRAVVRPVPGYRSLVLTGTTLRLPTGVELDLGATAKAVAADRAARLVADALGTGVLVSLGGDLATAGSAPAGGWQVRVQDREEDPWTQVAVPAGGAVATSSTVSRTWRRGGRRLHHVVDPRTGQPAGRHWRSVTVAAGSCLVANAVSTACLVRGAAAADWVRELGLPARFLRHDGRLVLTDSWPQGEAA